VVCTPLARMLPRVMGIEIFTVATTRAVGSFHMKAHLL
jgi:hypothetical protein